MWHKSSMIKASKVNNPHAFFSSIHTCTVLGEAILLSAVDILLMH